MSDKPDRLTRGRRDVTLSLPIKLVRAIEAIATGECRTFEQQAEYFLFQGWFRFMPVARGACGVAMESYTPADEPITIPNLAHLTTIRPDGTTVVFDVIPDDPGG